MAFNRSLRHLILRAGSVLPLFDSVFGVALTFLAFSLPESVMGGMDADRLISSIASYGLTGVAVLIYWFKLRRLIELARFLHPPQIILGVLGLMVIVLLPRMAQLVILYGNGDGDLFHWTSAQIVNVTFLAALLIFDGLCLLFALTMMRHRHLNSHARHEVMLVSRCQLYGFLVLLSMGIMELLLRSFNNQYILLVPLVLIAEELLVAWHFVRAR
jgi:uncharacterized membrane protein